MFLCDRRIGSTLSILDPFQFTFNMCIYFTFFVLFSPCLRLYQYRSGPTLYVHMKVSLKETVWTMTVQHAHLKETKKLVYSGSSCDQIFCPFRPKRTLYSKKYGVDLIRYTHGDTQTVVYSSNKLDGNNSVLPTVSCGSKKSKQDVKQKLNTCFLLNFWN